MPHKNLIKTCEQCGREFHADRHTTRYCSQACHFAAHRVTRQCETCGVEFTVTCKTARRKAAKYCSLECAHIGRKDPSKRTGYTCEWCGKEFEDWTYRQRRFCSAECQGYGINANRPKRGKDPQYYATKHCEICGKLFERHRNYIDKARFCSYDCMNYWMSHYRRGPNHHSWQGGYTPNYGPNWRKQRQRVRKRDRDTCQICGKRAKRRHLDVHHIISFCEFNGDWKQANKLSNLITLCKSCHRKVDAGKLACPQPLPLTK